jgi:hypothetical protein
MDVDVIYRVRTSTTQRLYQNQGRRHHGGRQGGRVELVRRRGVCDSNATNCRSRCTDRGAFWASASLWMCGQSGTAGEACPFRRTGETRGGRLCPIGPGVEDSIVGGSCKAELWMRPGWPDIQGGPPFRHQHNPSRDMQPSSQKATSRQVGHHDRIWTSGGSPAARPW